MEERLKSRTEKLSVGERSTPGRAMMSRRTATAFGLVAAASLLWMIGLVAGNLHAPTVETGRSNCGSAMSVVGRGSGYQGGEMRVDEGSFDQICVDRARGRLRLAAIPGGILAGVHPGHELAGPVGPPQRPPGHLSIR